MRKRSSHKGENGYVLTAGGCREFVGAPTLAGLAALRAGADLSVIAAPEKVAWAINRLTPDLITLKMKGDYLTENNVNEVLKRAEKADVLLIGPGLSLKSKCFVKRIVKKTKEKLKVIDADAIKALSDKELSNSIITPHEKELEIFLKNSKKNADLKGITSKKKTTILKKTLKDFFMKNNVLLLKGPTDIIISEKRTALNKTGNAGMTVGGTGDILAGITAGYLAQTKDLFKSAVLRRPRVRSPLASLGSSHPCRTAPWSASTTCGCGRSPGG